MKQLLIIGATGRTGQEIIQEALGQHWQVIALARNPAKIAVSHPNLRIVRGSPSNIDDLRTLGGFDAVVSALSHFSNYSTGESESPDFMTKCMRNIVSVMQEKGVRRIVLMTGAGAGESFRQLSSSMQQLIRTTPMREAYADHDGQEEVLKNSATDWTLVRPVALTDNELTGYRVIEGDIEAGQSISRKTVAHFIVRSLDDPATRQKAFVIASEIPGH